MLIRLHFNDEWISTCLIVEEI